MLEDIDKETVNFRPNYDDSTKEPEVIPARIPNLTWLMVLVVLRLVWQPIFHRIIWVKLLMVVCAYVDNPANFNRRVNEIIPGPDFPTGRTNSWEDGH